jgi:hypothetical protein
VGTRYEIETGDGSSIRVDVEQDDAVSGGTLVSEPFLSLSALFFYTNTIFSGFIWRLLKKLLQFRYGHSNHSLSIAI